MFGPKIKKHHISNALVYTKHKNNKIKAKKIYTGGVTVTSKTHFGAKNMFSKPHWKIAVFGLKLLVIVFLCCI